MTPPVLAAATPYAAEEGCLTTGGLTCVFPFTYRGVTYRRCVWLSVGPQSYKGAGVQVAWTCGCGNPWSPVSAVAVWNVK